MDSSIASKSGPEDSASAGWRRWPGVLGGDRTFRYCSLALRWSHVDLVRRTVSINSSLVTIGHEVVESSPKSAHSRRTIALDAETTRVLQRHAERQALEISRVAGEWCGSDLLFTAVDGSPLHPNAFSRLFKAHIASAPLPQIRLHDLRHTHATLAPGRRPQHQGRFRATGSLERCVHTADLCARASRNAAGACKDAAESLAGVNSGS